jgi:hypothetical protein
VRQLERAFQSGTVFSLDPHLDRALPLQRAFALLDERFILDAFLQGKRAFAINNPDVHGITNRPA